MSPGLQMLARKLAISAYYQKLQRKLILSFLGELFSETKKFSYLIIQRCLSSVYQRKTSLQLQGTG